MSAVQGARARARVEVSAAIKDEARRQLVEHGAAKLSLRAVSRELGMASSALYRYFSSRDDLLTALIVESYDAIGEAAEAALDDERTAGRPLERWVALCVNVRSWALEHTHEYALIYGSPVPGYSAPRTTVAPASRVALALVAVLREAEAAGALDVPPLPEELAAEARRIAQEFTPDLPSPVVAALVGAWAQLFGAISFEVFGQFHGVVEDRETFFRHTAAQLAHQVGFHRP